VEHGDLLVAFRGQEMLSVASRVVNPVHDELRPAVSKELYHYRGIKCLKYTLTQLEYSFLFSFRIYGCNLEYVYNSFSCETSPLCFDSTIIEV
jgi:hypothetical protein